MEFGHQDPSELLRRRSSARGSAIVAVVVALSLTQLYWLLVQGEVLAAPPGALSNVEAATLVFELCLFGWASANPFVFVSVRALSWIAIMLMATNLLVSGASEKLGALGVQNSRMFLHVAVLAFIVQMLLSIWPKLSRVSLSKGA